MKRCILVSVFLLINLFTFGQAPMNVVTKAMPIPYDQVENQPLFPGGINEFMKFIGKNFQPPSDENFSGGILTVTFIIETNGSISDIKVIKDLGYGTANEIVRVLQASPQWKPADQEGKAVRVLYTLPVTIKV